MECNASIASYGCLQDGPKNTPSVVLSKLKHLDLSARVLDKGPAKKAHGGYCDAFIGYLAGESPLGRRVDRMESGKVKVAIKYIRIRLDKEVQLAKVRAPVTRRSKGDTHFKISPQTLARELAVWSTVGRS